MARSSLAPVLVGVGVVLILAGVLLWAGAGSWFGWFGRLPGDIRVERPGMRLHAPLASMLVLSIALSAVVALIRRLWP